MEGTKDMAKRKIIREYRPSAYYQIIGKVIVLSYAAMIPVATILGIVAYPPNLVRSFEVFLAFVIAIIYGLVAWRVFFLGFVDKIVITPDGIAVEGWHKAFADWETLSHFETQMSVTGRNRSKIQGIHTTKSVFERKSRVWFNYVFTDNFIPISHVYRIPHRLRWKRFSVEIDLEAFAQTPLGQDLRHYAPHLFEQRKAKHDEA